jgi:hypothetical protein
LRHVERGAGGTEPNNRPSKSNHRSHRQSRSAPWHDRLHAPARTTRPMRHRDCEEAHTLQQKFFVLAFRAITVALWGRPRRRSHGRWRVISAGPSLGSRRMIRACVSSSRREARSPSHARIYRRGTPIQAVPAGTLRHLTNAVPALSQAPLP